MNIIRGIQGDRNPEVSPSRQDEDEEGEMKGVARMSDGRRIYEDFASRTELSLYTQRYPARFGFKVTKLYMHTIDIHKIQIIYYRFNMDII